MKRDRADREQKAEMARHDASEKEKNRQLEADKLAVEETKIRLEREKFEAGTTRGGDETERRTGARGPKLAVWNDKEDMDGCIKTFENIARHNKWDRR